VADSILFPASALARRSRIPRSIAVPTISVRVPITIPVSVPIAIPVPLIPEVTITSFPSIAPVTIEPIVAIPAPPSVEPPVVVAIVEPVVPTLVLIHRHRFEPTIVPVVEALAVRVVVHRHDPRSVTSPERTPTPALYHYNARRIGPSPIRAIADVDRSGDGPTTDVDVGRHPLRRQRPGSTGRERGTGCPDDQQLVSHGVPPPNPDGGVSWGGHMPVTCHVATLCVAITCDITTN